METEVNSPSDRKLEQKTVKQCPAAPSDLMKYFVFFNRQANIHRFSICTHLQKKKEKSDIYQSNVCVPAVNLLLIHY